MTKILITLFCVFFHSAVVIKSDSYVTVDLWQNGDCEGHKDTYSFERTCYYFPNYGYKISGVSVPIGSCLHIYKNSFSCTGETYMIAYPTWNLCELPCCGWNDHVLSVTDCTTRNANVNCPAGSYIRQIESGAANQGLTVRCYTPGGSTPTYSGNTHGSPPSGPTINSCPIAAHGFSMTYGPGWRMYTSPKLECSRTFDATTDRANVTETLHKLINPMQFVNEDNNNTLWSPNHKENVNDVEVQDFCSQGTALSGLTVNIDEAQVIKEMSFRCTQVPDPTSLCQPQEMLGLVAQCDNSGSSNQMECSYAKTIGVGQSKIMTETERKEMAFYMAFGFTFGGGIPGLSASMSSLGQSKFADYMWTRTDSSTWKVETTVTASFTLQPHTKSKLEQLVGKCSFYGTSVNFFKLSDVNVKTGEQTIKYFST